MAHSLGFNGDGFSFLVFTGQSFWLRVLPGGACIAQPRCMPARILGGGRHVTSPFDRSQTLLIGVAYIFMILTGTSCDKITHQMVTLVCGQDAWFQSVCFPKEFLTTSGYLLNVTRLLFRDTGNTQLCMCLVVKLKSNAVKDNNAQKPAN